MRNLINVLFLFLLSLFVQVKSGTVVVRDADSGEILFPGSLEIPVNSKTEICLSLKT